ncbi:MAG TPA: hypothetical protein VIY73_27155 [Polyangiaceae bacterium]
MRPANVVAVVLSLVAAGSAGCGGTTGTQGAAGSPEGGAPMPQLPAPGLHRLTASECPSNVTGGAACSTDADCQSASPGPPPSHCFQGACGADQCLEDSDCGATGVCSCAGQTRGYAGASPGNVCVQANCRVDTDCGAGYCAPTVSAECGSFYGIQGYYCHEAGDACFNDQDCSGGGPGQPFCAYDPTVGRWACETGFCAG